MTNYTICVPDIGGAEGAEVVELFASKNPDCSILGMAGLPNSSQVAQPGWPAQPAPQLPRKALPVLVHEAFVEIG